MTTNTDGDFGDFRLSDLRNSSDPYRLLEQARAVGGPVGRAGGVWLVLGHAEATSLLRSSSTSSGFVASMYRAMLPPGAAADEMSHRINFLDPPRHTRVRRVVSKAFTPRRVSGLRPFLERTCRESLEALLRTGDEVDIVSGYAHEIPSLTISELLGVPAEDRSELTALSQRVSNLLGLRADMNVDQECAAAERLHAYLLAQIEERRRDPRDDLLGALLEAEDEGDRLTQVEVLSLAATLYSAGHRTTRDLFSNGLAALLQSERTLGAYLDGRLPTSAIVEEFLRFETPTFYVARMLNETMRFDEIAIPPGEPIFVVLAAANRDAAAYDRADRFFPERWTRDPAPPPSLSFAFGAHFCLGANLARLEAEVMLEVLLELCPDIALAKSGSARDGLAWLHSGLFRSLESLPVVVSNPGCGPRS